jgi:predicted transposase/invertase (TIGR01784 family)
LDFTFDDYGNEAEKSEVVHTIKLKNQNGKTFYDKLTYIYLEMPNFKQQEDELKTRLDKWLYFIKHLEDFETIPVIFKDEVFTQAFEKAELAKLGPAELDNYEGSLKIYRDLKGVIDTAFEEGRMEGKEEGKEEGRMEGKEEGRVEERMEVGRKMKQKGFSNEDISGMTGLSKNEIENL